MKKTLLVSAVAAAMVVSGTAYAAASDGLYGKIRLRIQTSDGSGAPATDNMDLNSSKMVFGFKGSEDLGNGLTASYGIEFEHDDADFESVGTNGGITNDASWFALSGDFGKVIAGEFGDLAGYVCGGTDLLTIGSAEVCDVAGNTSPPDAIQYRGSAGAVDFGVIYTMDGSDFNNTQFGAKYSADSWSVGGQFVDTDLGGATVGTIPSGESGSIIGGTYQLGDIGLGLVISDDGSAVDEGGAEFGLYMPLGSGTLAVVLSTFDTANTDSTDVNYNHPLGGGAFWGVELNDNDALVDSIAMVYAGINF